MVRAKDTPVVKLAYRDVPNQLSNLLVCGGFEVPPIFAARSERNSKSAALGLAHERCYRLAQSGSDRVRCIAEVTL